MRIPFDCYLDVTKAYEEKGNWIVEGFAATTDFDLQDDIVSQEAIESSAKDLIENSTVLLNHNPDESMGKVMESRAREGALFLKILVSKTVPEIWQKIKEGVLNKFSIRGKILEAVKKWIPAIQKFARVILKMHLVEVSVVAVPANPKARALRWYIEKALSDYEEGGGEIEKVSEEQQLSEGGSEMAEEMVEEELIEAEGEPQVEKEQATPAGDTRVSEKGFPSPEELWEEWTDFGKEKGLKEGDEAWEPWLAFCKQNGYPYPYPYPYPKPGPQGGNGMRRIVEIVDALLAGEEDEKRKKLLQEMRGIAAGASYPYPCPRPQEKSGEPAGKKPVQKNAAAPPPEKTEKPQLPESDIVKKLQSLEEAVSNMSKSLGIAEKKEGEKTATLAETVQSIAKRLEALEGTPGERSSLEGQEEPPGKKKDGKLWQGVL